MHPGDVQHDLLMDERKKATFYEAAYLAAAHNLNAILVTADQSFARNVGNVQGLCLRQNLKP